MGLNVVMVNKQTNWTLCNSCRIWTIFTWDKSSLFQPRNKQIVYQCPEDPPCGIYYDQKMLQASQR